jgi:molybdate transport system substrate-binding protein
MPGGSIDAAVEHRYVSADTSRFFSGKSRMIGRAVLALALALAPLSARGDEQPLHLLAAGSLAGALGEIAKTYSAETGIKIETAFGPSGALRERIETGEPADVFASANMGHPLTLSRANRSGPVVLFVRNRLCAVTRADVATTTATLLDTMLDPAIKLGTYTPKTDPGGDYTWLLFAKAETLRAGARTMLEGKALQLFGTGPRPPIPAGRDAVAYFLGERQADVFLAYCSAGKAAQRDIATLQIVPLADALAVGAEYGITVLRSDAAREAAAERFALYILSPAGQSVLARHGFLPVAALAD